MSDVLVTIVLPIYNVEKYLHRSVESVVNQTYRNIEILLVDDGSPDNCPALCDEWAEKDDRVRVIHKPNGGLSSARNSGIAAARGEYIFFLDSDDFVQPNLVERCVNTARQTDAQVVVYGYDRLDKHGAVVVRSVPELPRAVMRGDEIRAMVIPCLAGPMMHEGKKYHLPSTAWGAMYSMRVIRDNDFTFVSEREIISEDMYSNLIYYQYVDVMAIIPDVFYHYCENNDGSLTRAYNPKRFERNRLFYRQTRQLCDTLGYPEQAKKNLSNQLIGNTIAAIKQTVHAPLPFKQRRTTVAAMLADETIRQAFADYDLRLDDRALRRLLLRCMKRQWVGLLMWLIRLKK